MTNASTVIHSNAGGYDILPTSTTDERLIAMWLDAEDKKPSTQDTYARHVRQFLQTVSLPLQAVTLADLQAWQQTLTDNAATVKSKTAQENQL